MTATDLIKGPPREGAGGEEQDLGIWPPDSAEPRWDRLVRRFNPQAAVTFVVVVAAVVFVVAEMQPSQLLKNTTPTGGDMGAHVWLPAFVKRVLIPQGRFDGWAPDWYDGFPALTFYFPLPVYLIAFASYVIPYNIAFKLVSVLGIVTLPLAAWAFGRLARVRFPVPAALAVASVPFLFGREFTIYGGNIASTMAGEFSFSIGLSLALIFLGLVARGLQDGKHRAKAAVVLVLTGLCHVLTLVFAVVGLAVLLAMALLATRDLRRLRWAGPVLVVGGALLAFWALPFYWYLPYSTNMGYEDLTDYWYALSHHHDWLVILGVVGLVLSVVRRNSVGVFLSIMAGLSALAFVASPASRILNGRFLPFWYLCLYLLAGVAICEVLGALTDWVVPEVRQKRAAYVLSPIVVALLAGIWVGYPLRQLPFGHLTASGAYDWLGIKSTDASFVPDWVYWNYSGYQGPTKTRRAEYFALVAEMKKLGQDPRYGCGTAMWEYEPELNDMGTPDALMLLPYWTKGCIGSEEGLYYESSATTPYHFINVSELSDQPSDPVRGLDYAASPNVAEGVEHLQMLGDKYFMADTPDVEAAANADPNLELIARVGPYPVTYTNGNSSSVRQVTWNIYLVLGSQLVAPLVNQPVVVTGVAGRDPKLWLDAAQSWYLDPARWSVLEAAAGPPGWTRVSPEAAALPKKPLPPLQVSGIVAKDESISFNVDRTGVPVLVRESYFPNWQVKGGEGPYRVAPNEMVVIPTADHVTLTYGKTTLDWVADLITLVGLAGLVVLWRKGPVAYAISSSGDTGDPERARWHGDADLVFWGGGNAAAKVTPRMSPTDSARLDQVFKAYDIRGLVPQQLDEDLCRRVGQAFAVFCGAQSVLVARDMRPSGLALARAFTEGVLAAGVDVVDLGLASTDELYFASGYFDSPGAMFTASHNPASYNGIKLCRSGARPVGMDSGLAEIKRMIEAGPEALPEAAIRGIVTSDDVLSRYAAKVRSFVDLGSLRPLKVIADTANGMGGLVLPAVFSSLPFDLEILFAELDGTFPNHPADPIQVENLAALRQRILETGAHVGLAFDGDADRCFLVDDKGEPLSGSTTTALVAAALLDKHPGATILYNLICSKAVPEIVRERGGTPVRTRVGHSYIKAVMADTGALFGGEHSGHYYFRDNYRADSGAIAALLVLEVLSKSDRKLSEIRKDFERYASSGEINSTVPDPASVIEQVSTHYASAAQDRLDGLSVDLGDWWFNLRPSNTEPLLRLNLEAGDPDACARHTEEVLGLIRRFSGQDSVAGGH